MSGGLCPVTITNTHDDYDDDDIMINIISARIYTNYPSKTLDDNNRKASS